MEDFEYVVTQQDPPRICFGTALVRDVLPTSGPSLCPFMRRMQAETYPQTGPGSHDPNRGAFYGINSMIYSTLGLGSHAPRFAAPHVPQGPLPALVEPEPWQQNCAPFNSTSKRKSLVRPSEGPSPCDYKPSYKKREVRFAYSFNGKKHLICPIQVKCVPYNLDECGACGCLCSAQGDYWQFENRLFLCRKHYDRMFTHCLAKFQGVKLADFKSIRDCFFCHMHNSCKAAVKIMSHEEITKKLRKEAYLDLYFPQRRFCDY